MSDMFAQVPCPNPATCPFVDGNEPHTVSDHPVITVRGHWVTDDEIDVELGTTEDTDE